jgi:hypothetical protein
MEMVLAETRRIVKVTAPLIDRRNSLTLPMKDTKLTIKSCSLSVMVGAGEPANVASMIDATRETSSFEVVST